MKIKSLIVCGFKGVQDKVTIPLSSITLLFGANSTGKSTILHALLYLYEIIVERNFDPQFSEIAGQNLFLGGFKNLVNGKDLNKIITIGAELDFGDLSSWDCYLSEEEIFLLESHFCNIPYAVAQSFSFEIDIAWDKRENSAYIKRYECYTNGASYLCYETSEEEKLAVISHYEPLEQWSLETEVDIRSLIYDSYQGTLPILHHDALPPVDKRLCLDFITLKLCERPELEDGSHNKLLATRIFIESMISQISLDPLRMLANKLKNLLHIGPLRIIPGTISNQHLHSPTWYDGSLAWKSFAFSSESLIKQVNLCFNEDGFKSHYEFDITTFDSGLTHQKEIFVNDKSNNIKLKLSDIGVGISQVFPFIFACNFEKVGIISCEQPELHIHPKWQLALADIMLSACNKNPEQMFLIETHSEHLMLRLLKRRRQTAEGEITKDDPVSCVKKDIQIIFCEKVEGKTIFRTIKTTDEGEFDSHWPDGFFEERREELF